MKEYNIIIETLARQDILDIRRYIAETFKEPDIAKRIYEKINAAIRALDQFPGRNAVVPDEPYNSLGIRKLLVGNYIAFYIVNEQQKEVRVTRVLYNRRNWQKLL
ncbi:MAG: type II toxin-antitoxin system RelE/ParE family toxin [Oscillospiraceae bacterium]|nr:type II toxin-antitoxin system RelE/ParE family toxin [Oscillospiraceae bacterium]